MPSSVEINLLYVALSVYIVGAVLFNIIFIFKKVSLEKYAFWSTCVGLFLHGASIIYRWIDSGHGPYLGRYEELSSVVWVWLAFFVVFTAKKKELRNLGSFILPVSVTMMGWVLLSDSSIQALPKTYYTYWLIVHILFAKLSFGAGLMGVAIAALFLIKESGRKTAFLDRFPDQKKLDDLSYKFMAFAFIFDTFMISAGAIWAHYAWGNYWSWSDLEVWSLITWLLTGLYLHLRITFKFKGVKSAWMIIGIFVLSFVTMFGIPFVSNKVHKGLV